MSRTAYRHAGPRRRTSWWRGPGLPTILLVALTALLAWEMSWAVPLLIGG